MGLENASKKKKVAEIQFGFTKSLSEVERINIEITKNITK
jgi:hypothetical protein